MIYRMQADEDTPNALPNLYGVDYSAAVYDLWELLMQTMRLKKK